MISRRAFLAGSAGGAALALAGCATGTDELFTGGGSGTRITVAIVSNSQMEDAISLSPLFESEHPGVHLNFVSLPENEARAKITADVSTQGGEFDVVMISNYETPMWSANGWLVNLQPYINATPGYDAQDFLPQLRATLSHKGDLYSVPFYGESSFLMYRQDLMSKYGITMPKKPTWKQVAQIAQTFHSKGLVGICMRGDPGWGENLAPMDTVINAYGGRWFDPQWQAQLTSPEVTSAVTDYVSLVQKYGEPGAPAAGFSECATLYSQGDAAMWYDATSAVSTIEDPA
ncbi:MAG TPA: extracellular solute-binding protein, partial [Streptosporangiaceae bacterium]|nr:extracellular solute-binding protein [Streptosporangiaceae bacterium]